MCIDLQTFQKSKVTWNVTDINKYELNLGYLFQPASQRDEDKEHRRCVEERDGIDFCLLRYGHN